MPLSCSELKMAVDGDEDANDDDDDDDGGCGGGWWRALCVAKEG